MRKGTVQTGFCEPVDDGDPGTRSGKEVQMNPLKFKYVRIQGKELAENTM